MRTATHWCVLAGIAALWGVSLAMPAVDVRGGPTVDGLDLLLQGWQGAARGIYAWSANPLFGAAMLAAAVRRHRLAGVAAGAALVLALTSFAAEDLLAVRAEQAPDLALRGGFYVWVTALAALFIWSWVAVYLQHRNYPPRPPAAAERPRYWD